MTLTDNCTLCNVDSWPTMSSLIVWSKSVVRSWSTMRCQCLKPARLMFSQQCCQTAWVMAHIDHSADQRQTSVWHSVLVSHHCLIYLFAQLSDDDLHTCMTTRLVQQQHSQLAGCN